MKVKLRLKGDIKELKTFTFETLYIDSDVQVAWISQDDPRGPITISFKTPWKLDNNWVRLA